MRSRYLLAVGAAFACAVNALFAADDPAFIDQVRKDIARLEAEKVGRTMTQRKVASALLAAERTRKFGRASEELPDFESGVEVDPAGTALMDLRADVSPGLLAAIARLGGVVEHSHAGLKSIRARIPVDAVEVLAARNDVRSIKPAALCKTNAGPRSSEGDVAHRANLARANFGATGRGVKVGVLSDSVDHLARSQAGAELNSVTVLAEQSGLGRRFSGEGTAMLEIVHDIAPDAELFFATAFRGDANFAQNIRDLAAAGCTVIIDDVLYFNESPFQDGIIAQAVRDVTNQGVLYFSSAGNSGNFDDATSGTWEGDFVAGRDRGPKVGQVHAFQPGVLANRLESAGIVNLFWANPQGQATDDYDLYIANARGRIVRASNAVQDGDDDPYEVISARRGESVIVVKFKGEDRFLYIDTGGAPLKVSTPGNIRGHAAVDSPNAFGVAATSAFEVNGPFTGGTENPVERFSSDGFRRMFFLPDGTPITPGDLSATGGTVLLKPDLTAADGVSTSVPGFNPFFGTSAAAPHAGAIAALLRSFKPNLTGAQIRAALETTALDTEAAGDDRDSGAGILDAQAALQSLSATPNADPVLAIAGGSVTYTENGEPVFVDPTGTINDADNTHFQGGSLTVAIITNQTAGDRLRVISSGFEAGQIGVSGNNLYLGGQIIGSVSATLPLAINFTSGAATSAVATAVLRRVAFDSTSERPTNQDRTIRVTITDGSGGSDTATRLVDVLSVNDAPSFTKGPDIVIRNDTTTQTIDNWATAISAGPGEEEADQMVEFIVSTNNNAIFDKAPEITPGGTLSFRLDAGGSAFATVTVKLRDDGVTTNGGINESPSQNFRIYRNPANVPPSFVGGPDIVVGVNAGPATFPGWATGISAGEGETTQVVNFEVMVDNTSLFTVAPAISANGTLTFAPSATLTGTAIVTVLAHDNGGGLDTSGPQTFTISVASFAEEIGVYNGLATPASNTPREFARFGLLRGAVSRNGGLTAVLALGGRTYRVKGDVNQDGVVTFGNLSAGSLALPRPGLSTLSLTLRLDTASGTDVLAGAINDGAASYAIVAADRAAYSRTKPAPVTLVRKYTAAFPARSQAQLGVSETVFPQGDGFATGSVASTGSLRFTGRLADGSRVAYSSALSKANTFPLHIQTDKNRGSLNGSVIFRDVPNVSDADGADLVWFKPIDFNRKVYPLGWAPGITTDFVASAFAATRGQPILPGLLPASPAGNAQLVFSGLGIGTTLEKTLSIDPRSRARVIGVDDDRLRFRLSTASGLFGAALKDAAGRDRVRGAGVVLQKQGLGTGFFLQDGESGGILLAPKIP